MIIFATILLLIFAQINASLAQTPLSHQNWNSATISNGSITIDCAPLLLPVELGRELSEPHATTLPRGEMDKSLRSAHPTKVLLTPQTGTADDLTTISSCTTNGSRVQLATGNSSHTITVKHTPGSIEFFGGTDVVLSSPLQILTLQRKSGIWVSDGGVGSGAGGGSGGVLESLNTGCALGEVGVSNGSGGVDCGPSLLELIDCGPAITLGQLCFDTDSGLLYRGDGITSRPATPAYNADCTSYVGIGQLCIDTDDGNIWRGDGESATCASCASGSGGVQGIDDVFAIDRIASGLNSEGNAAILGNGTTGLKFFNSTIKCFDGVDTCDIVLNIPSGKNLRIQGNGTDAIVINSSGIATLSNSAIEYNDVVFNAGAITADGTNCTDAVERTINSGPRTWVLNCSDNAASVFQGSMTLKDSYNGMPVFFLMEAVNENAAPGTTVLDFDFSAMCRSDGDIIDNNWGAAQSVSITFQTQYRFDQFWSGPVTPNGTCQAGDKLFWRAVMDSPTTNTQVANTYILSVKMKVPTNKWSD